MPHRWRLGISKLSCLRAVCKTSVEPEPNPASAEPTHGRRSAARAGTLQLTLCADWQRWTADLQIRAGTRVPATGIIRNTEADLETGCGTEVPPSTSANPTQTLEACNTKIGHTAL